MRARSACSVLLIAIAALGCRPHATTAVAWSTTASGLGFVDLAPGDGPVPRLGQPCVVEARGWVEEKGGKGTLFLDTYKRGYPATFPLGVGRVIKGWDEGVATMKRGGRRLLRVPPALGYTVQEAGHDIPPGATLLFEIELAEIR